MYYYNKKSSKKIIHTKECFRIQNSDIQSIGCFETLEDAYENGYRLCRNCSAIAKKYRSEMKEIINYSHKNGVSIFFNDKFIGLTSIYGKWKITVAPDGRHIRLYHKNEFETKNDCKSAVQGYHLQNVFCDSILDYLNYISEHDFYRMKNPLRIYKKGKKAPPRKGTRRYASQQRRLEEKTRKQAIGNVLYLIDSLQASNQSVM